MILNPFSFTWKATFAHPVVHEFFEVWATRLGPLKVGMGATWEPLWVGRKGRRSLWGYWEETFPALGSRGLTH